MGIFPGEGWAMCFPLAFGGGQAGKRRSPEHPDTAVVVCMGRVATWAEQAQACHLLWYHLLFSSRKPNVISMHDRADSKMESGVEMGGFYFPCVWHYSECWIWYFMIWVQRVGMWKYNRENHWGVEVLGRVCPECLCTSAALSVLLLLLGRPWGTWARPSCWAPQQQRGVSPRFIVIVLIRDLAWDLFRYSPSFFTTCSCPLSSQSSYCAKRVLVALLTLQK